MNPALLLLADGRFPAGGHAHSGGAEAAVEDGRVVDIESLATFVSARLVTVGLVEAAFSAAACAGGDFADLDAEMDARIPSPPLRAASRRLGRQLVRAAGRTWPHPVFTSLPASGAHQAVALGAVGIACGLTVPEVAGLAVHHAVTTPALAAVRLLGLDPYAVAALTAALCADPGAEVAARAVAAAQGPVEDLPSDGGPLLDLASLDHVARPIRMFAT